MRVDMSKLSSELRWYSNAYFALMGDSLREGRGDCLGRCSEDGAHSGAHSEKDNSRTEHVDNGRAGKRGGRPFRAKSESGKGQRRL